MTVATWKIFEQKSHSYLRRKLNDIEGIYLDGKGGSSSYDNDLELFFNGENIFNIESKLSPSQAGQLVVNFDNASFSLSNKMVFNNQYSDAIIDHLNKNIQDYTSVLSGGYSKLSCDENLICEWIKDHYKNKGVEFIITSKGVGGYYYIIPLEDMASNFLCTATLRRKKSGTRALPKKRVLDFRKSFLNFYTPLYKPLKFYGKGKKHFIEISTVISKRFNEAKIEDYYLSHKIDLLHEVKVKAVTNNPNVVFELTYNGPSDGNFGFDILRDRIQSYIDLNKDLL